MKSDEDWRYKLSGGAYEGCLLLTQRSHSQTVAPFEYFNRPSLTNPHQKMVSVELCPKIVLIPTTKFASYHQSHDLLN